MDLDQRLHHGDLLIQSRGLDLLAEKLFTSCQKNTALLRGLFVFMDTLPIFWIFPDSTKQYFLS